MVIGNDPKLSGTDMSFDPIRCAKTLNSFQGESDWLRIVTVDMHTGGEPLRIVASGFPQIPGRHAIERRQYCISRLDHLRKLLMWEPRGHADMYGCIVTPPNDAFDDVQADFGVLFMHNEGYSSMCGHGIIAVTKLAVETGLVPAEEPETTVLIDSPAGRITSVATVVQGCVVSVSFENVPAYVELSNQCVHVESIGEIQFDLAYGGAYYAYVDIAQLDLDLVTRDAQPLILAGRKIKKAVQQQFDIKHPVHDELSFLYGTIFHGPAHDPDNHSRNVCVFADGEVDRSPTGTGVSGRVAIHYWRGELALGETITIESILGTTFDVCPIAETTLGHQAAVVPRVTGSAHFTGRNEHWVDPGDAQRHGFLVR